MTPAVELAKKASIAFTLHEYPHDAGAASYGLEASEKLGLPPKQVFKTLLLASANKQPGNQHFVACLPVNRQLSLKLAAKALGEKKLAMAAPDDAERITGYLTGGISPLAQKKRLPTVIDASAESLTSIFVSAGRRGLEIELAPQDLAQLCEARFAAIANSA